MAVGGHAHQHQAHPNNHNVKNKIAIVVDLQGVQ
jgi:hypothetical protein